MGKEKEEFLKKNQERNNLKMVGGGFLGETNAGSLKEGI